MATAARNPVPCRLPPLSPAILISEMEFTKKETSTDRPPILPPPAHDPDAKGAKALKKFASIAAPAFLALALFSAAPASAAPARSPNRASNPLPNGPAHASPPVSQAPVPAGDTDQTLRAMHDEIERSRTRLQLPGVDKPFYIEYRLLDLDVRDITATFGGSFLPPPPARAI